MPMPSRHERLRALLARFVQQYARKAYGGRSRDPNDRKYSRKVETKVKGMRPEELDKFLND